MASSGPAAGAAVTGGEGGGGVLFTVPVGKDGLPVLGEDEDDDDSDEHDLWDVDGDMTAEQVTAALAEEKRRKKVCSYT